MGRKQRAPLTGSNIGVVEKGGKKGKTVATNSSSVSWEQREGKPGTERGGGYAYRKCKSNVRNLAGEEDGRGDEKSTEEDMHEALLNFRI